MSMWRAFLVWLATMVKPKFLFMNLPVRVLGRLDRREVYTIASLPGVFETINSLFED